MKTLLLYVDESISCKYGNDNTQIESLTGIVVDISKYIILRDRIYDIVKPFFIVNKDKCVRYLRQMPELHGNDLLR